MTNVMASLSVDVNSSKANETLFRDGNCFSISSNITAYSLRQMLRWVIADAHTGSTSYGLYDHRSSRFGIAFHPI